MDRELRGAYSAAYEMGRRNWLALHQQHRMANWMLFIDVICPANLGLKLKRAVRAQEGQRNHSRCIRHPHTSARVPGVNEVEQNRQDLLLRFHHLQTDYAGFLAKPRQGLGQDSGAGPLRSHLDRARVAYRNTHGL